MRLSTSLLASAVAALFLGFAQNSAMSDTKLQNPYIAELTIRADTPQGVISPAIYSHFAEHLGKCVYGGIWVGKDSKIPNIRGIRKDAIEALKELHIPILRWPGGCFADQYHWRDGIGPQNERPKTLNNTWGGMVETNAFGTHEFMDLCELIGAEPYISANVGTGSPQEMRDWVEYMTSDSDSTLANLRRKNGRAKPWKVPYLAVGNECWGCGGNMDSAYYANLFRQFSTFVFNHSGNSIYKVACGASADDYGWTETLVKNAGQQMDGLSLHYYTLPTGDWGHKGSATKFTEQEWFDTMKQTMRMDDLLVHHSAIMDKYDAKKRIGIIVDEWGTWYDFDPKQDFGILSQQNTMRDAVVAAVNLNLFNHHCDRVKMANLSQLANVLQSVLLTDETRILLTPTYHVMEMYKVHKGGTLLPVEGAVPQYQEGAGSIDALSTSASRGRDGKIYFTIASLDPTRATTLTLKVAGSSVRGASGRVLTAPTMQTINTFENRDAVKPQPLLVNCDGSTVKITIPGKAVALIEITP